MAWQLARHVSDLAWQLAYAIRGGRLSLLQYSTEYRLQAGYSTPLSTDFRLQEYRRRDRCEDRGALLPPNSNTGLFHSLRDPLSLAMLRLAMSAPFTAQLAVRSASRR